MSYNNKILLGRITKVSGYEGAVNIKLEKIFSENIPQMESVFLEIEGRPVPFLISDLEYSGADILKLTFEGYNTIEKISEFVGCRVFLTAGIPENKNEEVPGLNGYEVFVQDGKLLGTIQEIIDNPGQSLLSITSLKNKEILIPLHEHFIVSIDKKNRILLLNIPEGLADIN
jgi:16S rRNA processing protein RimM